MSNTDYYPNKEISQETTLSNSKPKSTQWDNYKIDADFPLLPPPPSFTSQIHNTTPTTQLLQTNSKLSPVIQQALSRATNNFTNVPQVGNMNHAFERAGIPIQRFESQDEYLNLMKRKLDALQKNPKRNIPRGRVCDINDHILTTTEIQDKGLTGINTNPLSEIRDFMKTTEYSRSQDEKMILLEKDKAKLLCSDVNYPVEFLQEIHPSLQGKDAE